jgi:hypothetical protein
MRALPRSTKSVGEEIYYVFRAEAPGVSPGTYAFDQIRREIYRVRGHAGRYARYDSRWHRIHEPEELSGLLREIRENKASTAGAFKYSHFNKSTDRALPFIKAWEEPIGLYPEAFY